MAAPPKITAQTMKQAQARKQTEHRLAVTARIQPHIDTVVRTLNGKLQLAFEAELPSTQVTLDFTHEGRIAAADFPDATTIFQAALDAAFKAGGRNFTISLVTTPTQFNIVLTWP